MNFLNKLLKPQEIESIFEERRRKNDNRNINVGKLLDIPIEKLIPLMNLWTSRIDKLLALDKEVHTTPTWRSQQASRWRGFTYEEYTALFNKYITEEQFPFYPIFNQLRKATGGINTEKQRTDFLFHYELTNEDYLRILREQGYDKLLSFFFGGLTKLNAYLPYKKLLMHTALVAPTGSGKTVLLETIFFRMTKKYQKHSFVLIDPHGDISARAKTHRHLKERCVYIEPFLKDGHTPTLNPFDIKDRSLKNINNVAEQIILAFEEVLNREGGKLTETMTNMLEKCIYFLLKRPNSTVMDLVGLLDRDEHLFAEAAKVDKFFDDFFFKQNNKTREGLLNRIGRLMNSPILFNLLGGQSTFDLEEAINRNKVVIFNLGGLGEMTQIAFGKFIIASLKSIVRKRNKPSKQHTFCFIDEAHNLVTGSFEYILSQLRGFGLHMVLANQYVEQYGDQAKPVKKNAAIKMLGGGDDNLEDIQKMIKVPKEMHLNDYEFYLKVRGKSILKFKSPSFLLKKKKKYYLSEGEEKQLDEYLIKNYYKPIGDESAPTRKIRDDDIPPPTDSLRPDFNIYIDPND